MGHMSTSDVDTKIQDKTKKKSSLSSAVQTNLAINATEVLFNSSNVVEPEPEEQGVDIQALIAMSEPGRI